MKIEYPEIQRIAYTCRSETSFLECEREKWEMILSHYFQDKTQILCVEKEFEHSTKYSSGKASYIERNQAMIDDSDYCIFYYDDTYKPEKRKYSKRSFSFYQPNSGTKLAYQYALRKNKIIFNIKTLL